MGEKAKGAGRGNGNNEWLKQLRVKPGSKPKLKDGDANRDFGLDEAQARIATARLLTDLEELQYKMYADGRFALLVVFQAIDGGGKDSTIRHVIEAFNPQGCTVTSFKAPSAEELRHDFLWRIHKHAPLRGEVAVFNRSHYEDVLVVRVDSLAPKEVWGARYQLINDFEAGLISANTKVVKFFLHISKDEQKRRFEERIAEPSKQWKFDPADLKKRAQWDDYQRAFEDMLSRCSTAEAPWYVIPGDRKWLRDLAVASVLKQALESLPLRYPTPNYDPKKIKVV
jgi:PPK2 family polyphosphate:nucleotide phosphotransferase